MFKELVKGHYRKAKARFSKKDKVPSEVYASYTPLKIFLRSMLSVDITDFLLMEGQHPRFVNPNGEFIIHAISWSKYYHWNDTIFRVYVEDDSSNEFIVGFVVADDEIQDIMIFQQIAAFEYVSGSDFWDWTFKVGFQTLDDDGIEYSKVSGWLRTENYPYDDRVEEMWTFKETFVRKTGISSYNNRYTLYSRKIESGETEWLEVGIQRRKGDPLVYQVGYRIQPETLIVM